MFVGVWLRLGRHSRIHAHHVTHSQRWERAAALTRANSKVATSHYDTKAPAIAAAAAPSFVSASPSPARRQRQQQQQQRQQQAWRGYGEEEEGEKEVEGGFGRGGVSSGSGAAAESARALLVQLGTMEGQRCCGFVCG